MCRFNAIQIQIVLNGILNQMVSLRFIAMRSTMAWCVKFTMFYTTKPHLMLMCCAGAGHRVEQDCVHQRKCVTLNSVLQILYILIICANEVSYVY